MALIVEDGTGVAAAESYPSAAFLDAYWAARPHRAEATAWAAASTPNKEGAAREATSYVDNTWGAQYRGVRRGYVQGLLFPRTGAMDDAGYPLPDLPVELKNAVAELAPKALSATLTPDIKAGGGVLKRVKAGSVEVEYAANTMVEKTYPAIERMLSGLLVPNSGAWHFGVTCRA
jgi:hypothetical protein